MLGVKGRVCRQVTGLVMTLLLFGAVAPLGSLAVADEPSADARPSRYANAADLVAYVRTVVRRMEEDFADGGAYEQEQQERVTMRAHTLSAIGLVLSCHDEKHVLRSSAKELIELCGELADQAEEFAKAKPIYEKIVKLVAEDGPAEGGSGEWESSADVAELMKAVPIINNQMRRGIQSRRFARSAKRTAMYAAALAAVAQASAIDESYDDDEDWQRMSREMRDGAAEAARAVRAGDQAAAKLAAEKIVKTCDACHEDYR